MTNAALGPLGAMIDNIIAAIGWLEWLSCIAASHPSLRWLDAFCSD